MKKVNIAGFEITKPDQVMIVMRALPGAGKSTRAKQLVENGEIHSTDEVIEKVTNGNYSKHFEDMDAAGDWSAHGKMHGINFSNAINAMKNGVSPVIIDNTNIRLGEARKYIEAALEMGLDDKNIKIEDIGDGGQTLEALAARNAHGVPLNVIEAMHKTYKASGALTVKRIVETKGEAKSKILYSAVVLDDKSRSKLLNALGHHIPVGWKIIAHHMTVAFASGFPENLKNFVDANCEMRAVAIGISDMAIAAKIEGFASRNPIPHITLAVNEAAGAKPVMSNKITEWTPLENYINLSGIGREIRS